jgi:plasmid replication initiation protein
MAITEGLLWGPSNAKSPATLEMAEKKLVAAFRAWVKNSTEYITVRLTEGQGRAILSVLQGYGGSPSTGAWRKANEKVRKALGVWEEK